MESYATKAHALTEPIDVYSEWIDSCREANEGVVAPQPHLDGEAKRRRKTQDDGSAAAADGRRAPVDTTLAEQVSGTKQVSRQRRAKEDAAPPVDVAPLVIVSQSPVRCR
uniref:Transcription elongation factor 1 homolog n=1 Tax=Zea mays TaxID=4577 RepID=A0A804Q584_MAIZE